MDRILKGFIKLIKVLAGIAIGCVCLVISFQILTDFIGTGSATSSSVPVNTTEYAVMNRYERYITNVFSDALDGVMSINKSYWLSDSDVVAPEPNQNCYGQTKDPAEMQQILDEAAELLEGQETLFKTDVEILAGSDILYYLDPTILVITWKQVIDNSVYTISEVKIADPSQFRRFLSDNTYGSGSLYLTSQMSASVNAVVATNGDYYAARRTGIVVYNGQIYQARGELLDTCFIDKNGDLQFVKGRTLMTPEAVKQYVEDNEIRFSICFGPILVDNGELSDVIYNYEIGHVQAHHPRAALCQMDSLHYLMVTTCAEPPTRYHHTTEQFAKRIHEFGCIKAYCLDGGRSATNVMNDKLINYVSERYVSDMIYFATAYPDGE